MIDIMPYPKRLHALLLLAAKTTPLIEKHGILYARDKRIEEISGQSNSDNILDRILYNTSVAFSEEQLQNMVRRELIEITGKSWLALRESEKNA